ncbi:MAG: Gfo/Idh/MocA family oxidoreductase [bacterium]|nr:Gfo/Idh/MocA family oxidoreductase [bacterium]
MGLIGAGGISRGDLRAFFAQPEVECVVICDVDDSRLAERRQFVEAERGAAPETVKDYRRVLDRSDIDVVLICTPDHWHALPTIHACQAGKDVYVEKPLAITIAEGRAMVEAARRHGRVVQMGTHWRSGEHWGQAIEYVRSGMLGKIRQVRVWAYLDWVKAVGNPPDGPPPPGVDYDMWLGPAPKRPFNKNRFHFNFRWFWDYAGGLMTDWGVHLINLALWGMGPEWPTQVVSSGGRYVLTDNTETPDTQMAIYEFPSYRLIFEHQVGNRLGPDRREHGVWFMGTDASVILHRDGWEVIPEPSKNNVLIERHEAPKQDLSRANHAGNFLDCVRSREDPVENLTVGHHVSTVAHLGNLAFRSGKPVTWDAKRERVVGNKQADELVGARYRRPWKLPYDPRG